MPTKSLKSFVQESHLFILCRKGKCVFLYHLSYFLLFFFFLHFTLFTSSMLKYSAFRNLLNIATTSNINSLFQRNTQNRKMLEPNRFKAIKFKHFLVSFYGTRLFRYSDDSLILSAFAINNPSFSSLINTSNVTGCCGLTPPSISIASASGSSKYF